MNKSVYSIVLADEVVEAIDRAAYEQNTSRSNLINQILAEHVGLMTPEMRMRDIFQQIRKAMDPRIQMLEQQSEAMMSLRSPVRYKYKPTVRYSVELTRDLRGKVGRLKVSFRTKSEQLIGAAEGFFERWRALEEELLGEVFPGGVPCAAEGGRYVRDFYSPAESVLSDRDIAGAIAGYIRLLDGCIQEYFGELTEGPEKAFESAAPAYREYLRAGRWIL